MDVRIIRKLLFNPTMNSLILCLSLIAFVNRFAWQSLPQDPVRSIERLVKAGMLDKAEPIYWQLLEREPNNLALHHKYLQIRFKITSRPTSSLDRLPLAEYYASLASNEDTSMVGYYGLGWIAIYQGNYSQALEYFQKVPAQNQTQVNYSIGYTYLQQGETIKAEQYFQREIALGGNVAESVQRLASLYLEQEEEEKFQALLTNPQTAKLIGYENMRRFLLTSGDWWAYLRLIFYVPYRNISLLGGLNALIICLVWMIFLTRIAVFNRKPFTLYLALLILGMLSANASLLFTDLLDEVFKMWIGEGFWYGLIRNILQIGVVEEFAKFLPLLLIVTMTRRIDEPFELIAYGSISALGFATLENALYFSAEGLGIVLSRFLYSTTIHLTLTAMVGYTWARARFLQPGNQLAAVILGVTLASVLHGVFDFFLGTMMSMGVLFSYVISLILAREYYRMICNTLNHSPNFAEHASRSSRLINFGMFLSVSFFLLLVGYLSVNANLSTDIANQRLLTNSLIALPAVIVLAGSLGKITLARGKWLAVFKTRTIVA